MSWHHSWGALTCSLIWANVLSFCAHFQFEGAFPATCPPKPICPLATKQTTTSLIWQQTTSGLHLSCMHFHVHNVSKKSLSYSKVTKTFLNCGYAVTCCVICIKLCDWIYVGSFKEYILFGMRNVILRWGERHILRKGGDHLNVWMWADPSQRTHSQFIPLVKSSSLVKLHKSQK